MEPSCRKDTKSELAVYLKLLFGTDNIDLTWRGKQVSRWNRSESPYGGFDLLPKMLSFSRRHAAASEPSDQDFCLCLSHCRNRNSSQHSLLIDLCLFCCCCWHTFCIVGSPFFKTLPPGHLVCRLTDSASDRHSSGTMTTSEQLICTYLGSMNDTVCEVTQ